MIFVLLGLDSQGDGSIIRVCERRNENRVYAGMCRCLAGRI